MPVTGQYTWTEKADHVIVKVFLKGVSPKKVDIFCTENILKVNYAPYLVDILLFSAIDPLKHKAVVKEGVLEVKLFKKVSTKWGFLELQEASEEQAIEMRMDSLKNQETLEKELTVRRRDKRVDDERHSLRKQMALDESERSRIDNLKAEEKQRAEEEMFAVFSKMNSESSKAEAPSVSAINRAPALLGQQKIDEQMLNRLEFSKLNKPIVEDDEFEDEIQDVSSGKKGKEDWTLVKHEEVGELDAELKYIPPPRAATSGGGKVEINFTPRMFPTPIRESKLAEEEDWIAKNRKHLKKHAVYGKALKSGNIEEEDPNWLKAKGDDFFRGGDFRSAINAYSSALELDEHNIACYSNRSICYLKLNMYSDCKDDCSAAIKEIIGVPNEKGSSEIELSLRPTMIKLLLRRGAASTQLGSFAEALHDYESSITRVHDFFADEIKSGVSLPVSIDLVSIEADKERLKKLVTAESLKREADVLVGEKSMDLAIQKYTEALAIVPCHVSCLSNRSACYLAIGSIQKCIDDCTSALQFLEVTSAKSVIGFSETLTMADTFLPATGTEKRKDWTLKTLIRRGAASIQIGDIKSSIRDYGYAVSIDPSNEALKSDLNKLISLTSSSSLNQ